MPKASSQANLSNISFESKARQKIRWTFILDKLPENCHDFFAPKQKLFDNATFLHYLNPFLFKHFRKSSSETNVLQKLQ